LASRAATFSRSRIRSTSCFGVAIPDFDFLLKHVQYKHPGFESDCVHGTISISAKVLDHFEHGGGTEAAQWLCLVVPGSDLRQVQGVSENVQDLVG
jgi:hypothetical protein